MKRVIKGLSAAVLLTSVSAAAQDAAPQATPAPETVQYKEYNGFIDLYKAPSAKLAFKDSTGSITLTPQELNTEGGKGTGGRVRIPLGNLFFQGEFLDVDYDGFKGMANSATTAKSGRLGLGYMPAGRPVYALIEHISETVEVGIIEQFSAKGYGAHVGIQGGGRLRYYAQLGYVDVGDFGSGVEYMIGGAYGLSRAFALFADHRVSKQEDDAGGMYEFADTRVGFRILLVNHPKKAKAPVPRKAPRA